MVHAFDNHNAALSEVGALPIVVRDFPETPHQARNNKHFPRPMRKSDARLRLVCPPLARRAGAPHERGAGGGSDPPFWPAGAAREGGKVDMPLATFSPLSGGRSLHSDPCGKAVESAKKPTAEKQQTTNGPQAERGKPGGCTHPYISDPQHVQLATPLDGLGLRVDTRLTCPSRS